MHVATHSPLLFRQRALRLPLPVLLVGAALLLSACSSTSRTLTPEPKLVDPNATRETKALFVNLQRVARTNVIFGHQDALAYGVTWKREEGRSDVKDVTGSYPGLYGWELGDLENGVEANLDGVRFDDMKRWIKQGYRRGGVITISWHLDNPVSGGDAWDTTSAVPAILPGGPKHEWYRQSLDRFADFVKDLKVGRFSRLGFGHRVPIIFRPFHEHTGAWFWWGEGIATHEQYRQLWEFTVRYLRDEKGVHNLLYAYNTSEFRSPEHFLEKYPGDAYVDILSYDDYSSLRDDAHVPEMTRRLAQLVEMAEQRGKIPALAETGLEGVKDDNWWTNRLLRAIKADPAASRIAYVLAWRNANQADKPGHFYAAYPGHMSAADMKAFRDDPFVLFEDELPDMYRVR